MALSPLSFQKPAKVSLWKKIVAKSKSLLVYFPVLFADHGILRLLWRNFYRVDENLYRANQPLPKDLAHYQKKYGIETVINLRGTPKRTYFSLEEKACAELNIELISISLRALQAPTKEAVTALLDALENIKKPTLIHCKSGIDRTGFACLLYLIAQKKMTLEEAQKVQKGKFFLWFKAKRANVIDFIFTRWQEANAASPLSLKDWFETHYDPIMIDKDFREHISSGAKAPPKDQP